jgi:multiple sugar transport system substrate-binding protein
VNTLIGKPLLSLMPLSRREFLRIAGTAAAGTALTACDFFQGKPTSPAGEKVQLVYQDWRTDWFPPMAQRELAQFHEAHPNISVFYVPDPENFEFEEKTLEAFQAGRAADVFQGCCTHFPTWAQKGYTLDLRPYVNADLDRATIEDWDPAQYRALFSPDGKQYGLPKYHGALALYYNKDLFDQYRVEYPDASWTFEDYQAAMKRLTRDLDGNGQTDFWGSATEIVWDHVQIHVNAWGGHLIDPNDPTQCRMCDPEALAAVEWLRARMWDEHVMASLPAIGAAGSREAFVAERIAMVEDGSWALKDILAGATFRVGVAPFPTGPARKVTLATTDGFGIYAGTKHPEAAWELLKFLISKEYGRAMARANFLQPARASLVEDWIGYVRAEFPEKAKEMDIAAFAEGHIKGYSVVAEISPNMAEANQIASAAWEQILTTGQAPTEQMKPACQKIQAVQK